MSQEQNHPSVAEQPPVSLNPAIEEALRALENLVSRFERLIEGRSPESLQQPGEDGRWGVVEVLCHLRDWELVLHERIRQMVEEDRPAFGEIDAVMWPLEHDYRDQDSLAVFAELAALRRALVERLRELPVDVWDRVGVMENCQDVTLRELIGMVVAHDEQYLNQAREAVA